MTFSLVSGGLWRWCRRRHQVETVFGDGFLPFLRFLGFLRFLRSNANGQRLERDIGKIVLIERDGEKDGGLVEREVVVTKDSE